MHNVPGTIGHPSTSETDDYEFTVKLKFRKDFLKEGVQDEFVGAMAGDIVDILTEDFYTQGLKPEFVPEISARGHRLA